MMGRMTGRRVVITGGATGIGAAAARRFAEEGAAVGILDLNVEDGQRVVSEIVDGGGRARFVACSVAEPEQVAMAVEEVAGALGGIDGVFANAGIGTIAVGGTVESIDPEKWDLAFAINARGVYTLCRAALPHLRAAGGGSVLMTSSSSALVGPSGRPTHAYAATKGALISLTRSMAVTYGPENVRVNALIPGFVRTRLTEDVVGRPEALSSAIEGIPLRRIAEPVELANCALFLLSDEASFVTGTVLVADGGQTVA
jgi:NAD(P)-dependent dehydrogenase (short-subunit alcohol dehydrogenase family)